MRTRYPCKVDILLICAMALGLYVLFVPILGGVRDLFAELGRAIALVGR